MTAILKLLPDKMDSNISKGRCEMAQISVNGKWIEAKDGTLLIDVLHKNGVNVPHFCYHPSLGKDGNCRMCMVEIEGKKRPQIACDTPVSDGQIIRTKGENIDKVKRSILELELINHPVDCPICDQAGECKLQDYYMDVGLYDSRLDTPKTHGKKHVYLGSEVMLDQERCVLCTRCVRFTTKITKTNELGVVNRADGSVISTFPGCKLDNPYAMNVVDLCPVGALTSRDFRFHKRVWFLKTFDALCDGCSKGCNISVDHHKEKYKDDFIYRYRPKVNEKINGYFICDKGRLSYKKENENRLFENYINNVEVTLSSILKELKIIFEKEKPTIILSPNSSLEEMMMTNLICKKYGMELVISSYAYYDENFGDDFLKSNDLAMNINGALKLDLCVDDREPKNILNDKKTAVFIGLKNSDIWLEESFKLGISSILISAYKSKDSSTCKTLIAMASHMERTGSFINKGGFLQRHDGGVVKNRQAPTLNEIFGLILGFEEFDDESLWEKELNQIFKNISLKDFTKESIRVEL